MFKFHYIAISALFLLTASSVSAATTAGLVNGLWFSTDPVTNFGETVVYSVLHNQTSEQIQGIATLSVDDEPVKAIEVTVGKGDIKRVGIPYSFNTGQHTVHMSFTAGNTAEVTHAELATRTIFVVADTDGDGIQNTTDPDDDNDGIEDLEDSEPLVKNSLPKNTVDLTESGKALFDKLITRDDSKEETVELPEEEFSTSTLTTTLASIENARKKVAAALAVYEEEQREALAQIAREEEALREVEGFEEETTAQEESKKREHQIAAAGASIAGVMISKAWMFYAELVVLTLGALHLCWVFIRNRFFRMGVEEE